MPAIEVNNLQKTFQSKRKSARMSSVVDITISDPPLEEVLSKIIRRSARKW
jgi:hypothetical protein